MYATICLYLYIYSYMKRKGQGVLAGIQRLGADIPPYPMQIAGLSVRGTWLRISGKAPGDVGLTCPSTLTSEGSGQGDNYRWGHLWPPRAYS